MKKIYQLIFISIFLSASNTLISQITTTNNFQNLTVADGLIDDDVTDVLIQNDSTIWIATSAGLSHYDGVNFSNYSAVGSNLNNDNISELEYCQNKIWMVTDSGISSFDGTTFANYSPSNGVISSGILGLAATSTINLKIHFWINSKDFIGSTVVLKSEVMRKVMVALIEKDFGMPADILELKIYQDGQPIPISLKK